MPTRILRRYSQELQIVARTGGKNVGEKRRELAALKDALNTCLFDLKNVNKDVEMVGKRKGCIMAVPLDIPAPKLSCPFFHFLSLLR